MVLAIHQPNYFPWLGYLDKMAKADEYVILDEVQLVKGSPMVRNQFLQKNGDVCVLGVNIASKGYREKQTREIELQELKKTQHRHRSFFELNYSKTKGFCDVWKEIVPIFEKEYQYLYEVDIDTMMALRKLYNINTKLYLQSELEYDRSAKKNDLMLEISKTMNADIYLSGQGAKAYMKDESFQEAGIKVVYQEFQHPYYEQPGLDSFVEGLSSLDMLMQVGVEEARAIFWENVRKTDNTKEKK